MHDNEAGSRGGGGDDLTAKDVSRHYQEAEDAADRAQANKEAGLNFSRHPGVLMEDNVRKVASPDELRIITQMEAKREAARQAVFSEQDEAIAAMKARIQQEQESLLSDHHEAPVPVEEPRLERPATVPQLQTEPSFFAKVGSFLKSFFPPTSQRKPA